MSLFASQTHQDASCPNFLLVQQLRDEVKAWQSLALAQHGTIADANKRMAEIQAPGTQQRLSAPPRKPAIERVEAERQDKIARADEVPGGL